MHSIFDACFWSDCEPPLCVLLACELGVVLCWIISRLFMLELMTELAPFGVNDGAAVVVFVPFIVGKWFGVGNPLRPDDSCVMSSTFGVSTDDRCVAIGSRQALDA